MNDMQKSFQDGIDGKNKGLPTGIRKFNNAIYNIQRGMIYGIASGPKVGKSTFVDSAFIINPYMHMLENSDVKIDFFYWSLEMGKLVVRFKAAAHFFFRDYNIGQINLPAGKTHKGSTIIPMQASYLLGRMRYDDDTPIIVEQGHRDIFHNIVRDRINPMFGEYDEKGDKISNGAITLIEDKNDSNPTGIYQYLLNYAKENGTFLYDEYRVGTETRQRISGYIPNDPEKYIIVVLDHLRNMKRESNYTMKQNMDKMTDYQVWLRNICNFTFVDIIHLNRNISDTQRIKFNNEFLYPNSSDLKDSGNLSEDADFLITLFNANDDRYNISKHFGLDIDDFPNYRSIHLVESRHSDCPVHIQTNMYAGVSIFQEI